MSHLHIGFFEFVVWLCYWFIAKALFMFINIEARRNRWHIPAAVSGFFS
jgi:hypothetical protein